MEFTDILVSQLTDVFRIGLLFFLVVTMRRNIAATGTVLPLLLGCAFVAVLIPNSLGSSAVTDAKLAVAVGFLSNAIILAVLLAGFGAYDRSRKDQK